MINLHVFIYGSYADKASRNVVDALPELQGLRAIELARKYLLKQGLTPPNDMVAELVCLNSREEGGLCISITEQIASSAGICLQSNEHRIEWHGPPISPSTAPKYLSFMTDIREGTPRIWRRANEKKILKRLIKIGFPAHICLLEGRIVPWIAPE